MERQVYTAEDLAKMLSCSKSRAYEFIRQMNEELKKDGYLTIKGKISKAYVNKRFFNS